MSHASPGSCEPGGVCITCSDQGIAMTVIALLAHGIALCAEGDAQPAEVLVELIDGVAPGDRILVHAGVAIAHLHEARSA